MDLRISKGFLWEINRMSSLFTVKFFKVVEKKTNESRCSFKSKRGMVSKRRSRSSRGSLRDEEEEERKVFTEEIALREELIVVFVRAQLGRQSNDVPKIVHTAHLELKRRTKIERRDGE